MQTNTTSQEKKGYLPHYLYDSLIIGTQELEKNPCLNIASSTGLNNSPKNLPCRGELQNNAESWLILIGSALDIATSSGLLQNDSDTRELKKRLNNILERITANSTHENTSVEVGK